MQEEGVEPESDAEHKLEQANDSLNKQLEAAADLPIDIKHAKSKLFRLKKSLEALHEQFEPLKKQNGRKRDAKNNFVRLNK